jgi:formylglycine-generating enzyme required for sulfatase activity
VEACDGLDNDCDGQTDEDFPELGQSCQNGGCAEGVRVCAPDGLGTRCDGPVPAADDRTCDGLDDDCDGETDEDAPAQACPLQEGVCAGAVQACAGGSYTACDYGPLYTPGVDARCDGLDDDCDGETDEDALLLVPESGAQAADGIDNNCNGLVDEPGGVMVRVPLLSGVWIDSYEATLFERADCTGTRYGEAEDDYPAGFPAEGEATVELYACALAGLVPSGHLSWYRAERACRAQGKRLCRQQEFAYACLGGLEGQFPYGWNFVPGACNDGLSPPVGPVPAGSRAVCTAGNGTYDLSGNMSEWQDAPFPEPGFPDLEAVSGFGFVCEFCSRGADCFACNWDDPNNRPELIKSLDCVPDFRHPNRWEVFPRPMVKPYLGARCCLDKP